MILDEDLGALAGRLVEGHHEEVKVHGEAVHDGHLRLGLGPNYPAAQLYQIFPYRREFKRKLFWPPGQRPAGVEQSHHEARGNISNT